MAVIEKITVDWEMGLSVFTGETGAGKSILIDAISLILGQRSNKNIVRTGAKKALVSAVFTQLPDSVCKLLCELGYEASDGELLISREISADGHGTARLMGRPVTVSILKEIGARLVSIHGQHDNEELLNRDNYLNMLDDYGKTVESGHADLLQSYHEEYKRYLAIKSEYDSVTAGEQEKARAVDLLRYEISEISEVNLKPGEDEALEKKLSIMHNAQKISMALAAAHSAIYDMNGNGGSYDLVFSAVVALDEVSACSTGIDPIIEQLSSIMYETEDAAEKLATMLESVEFNPAEVEYAEKRMDKIYELKRKYGSAAGEILDYCSSCEKRLDEIELSEQTAVELLEKLKTQQGKIRSIGHELSDSRKSAGIKFAAQICDALIFLDMPNVVLKVEFSKAKFGANGCDKIDFLFSTNKGEETKSIEKIASGGELSRLMLAIKSVLATNDDLCTLIFDEIDSGVSGSSAQKIGLKLKQVAHPSSEKSLSRQVLCVTHSAQIAALAEHNFLIKKETNADRTFTSIIPLDIPAKINEVARIMSTDKITPLMLQTARAMVMGS